MGNVTTIGLDIAKNVFQVHGVDADGAVVVRQRLTRGRMSTWDARLDALGLQGVSEPVGVVAAVAE